MDLDAAASGNLSQLWESGSENITQSGFATEKEAEDWLSDFINRTGCFRVYRQMQGVLLSRHHRQTELPGVRCDLLLLPAGKIRTGAIVIEVKKSGVAIGPSLSQLTDYLRSSFEVVNGIHVIPTYGFAFPVRKQHRATASYMSHQNLGTCEVTRSGGIVLFSGEERLLQFDGGGQLEFYRESACGTKTGAR